MTVRASRVPGIAFVSCFTLAAVLIVASPAGAAQAPVGLGTATSYAVLAGETVTNTGPSVITGDVGLSPGSSVLGFPPGLVNGTTRVADPQAVQAKNDLTDAYNDAASRTPVTAVSADLAGQTLVAGVYAGGALGLSGALTLDAQGDPNAVFVFQAASTLITASVSTVTMINGGDVCNVYWQVGSSATLGTNSTFLGTIMALTSITATTGASVSGRLLARNGAVTLDSNVINRPTCVELAPATTTTAAATTTIAAAPTSDVTASTVPPSTSPPTGTLPRTGTGFPVTVGAAGLLAVCGGLGLLVLLVRHPRRRGPA